MENLAKLCNRLPAVLMDKILEYQGFHCWRNGKYIARISLLDPRYQTLLVRNRIYLPYFEPDEFRTSVYINKEIEKVSISILFEIVFLPNNEILWIMNIYKVKISLYKKIPYIKKVRNRAQYRML